MLPLAGTATVSEVETFDCKRSTLAELVHPDGLLSDATATFNALTKIVTLFGVVAESGDVLVHPAQAASWSSSS